MLNAKGRHGIHSPFVYDFVDKCLRTKVPKNELYSFKNYLKDLGKDSTEIEINDLGAGSKKLGGTRKVKEVAKISGTRVKFGKILFKITNYYKPKLTLELGTSMGIGTKALANGHPQGSVISVDGCRNTSNIAQKYHQLYNIQNSTFICDDFQNFLKKYSGQDFDLVFIDGDHRREKLLSIISLLKQHTHDETIYILDDIRWSNDMLKAWNEIIKMDEFHTSIDLFKMGLIIRRPHQKKEHFILKST
ncbi:MAG: class I SAM-dependent methyltransferase [Brumimicrobium sp.]